MSRSKKIFLLAAIAFFIALTYFTYDFSRRTTFPGSGARQSSGFSSRDSLASDSAAMDTIH
jgi:hypothetical protein